MKWLWLLMAAAFAAQAQAQTQAQAQAPRSGFEFMSRAVQTMQLDDTQNPGMLWLKEGEQAWAAGADKSCASCHGAASTSMRGVATRYPAWDATLQRPITLAQRINECRHRHQNSAPLAAESAPLLGLETWVAHASRGLPLAPADDARLAPARALGEQIFTRRMGQLALSCSQCHDNHAGQRLGGSTIPGGHANGYPTYRLEWQGLGSLQRRVRNCMSGVRAEPFAFDSNEMVALELYLARRGAGLLIETPAVRP